MFMKLQTLERNLTVAGGPDPVEPVLAPAADAHAAASVGQALARVEVVVDAPQHAGLGPALTYLTPAALPPGTLVRIPLGRRKTTGIVWTCGAGHAREDVDHAKSDD